MGEYTKGPWTVGREWIDDGDGSEVEVFSVMAGDEPVTDQHIYEADARLMAAAPDLLEALQSVTDSYAEMLRMEFNDDGSECDLLISAKKAIAKALAQ